MKTVIHVVNEKITQEEVPDDYILCSISGEYRPKDEFCTDEKMTRTNCYRTYIAKSEDNTALRAKVKVIQDSNEYRVKCNELRLKGELNFNSEYASEMIETLQCLIKEHGENVRVLMTQEGYYADGKYADLIPPEKVGVDIEGNAVFSIGHSTQNY